MRRLVAREDLCTGCGTCQAMCSQRGDAPGVNPRWAVLRVKTAREGLSCSVVLCRQCENAWCAKVCDQGAIKMDPGGPWLVDPGACTGCGECVKECPYGAMFLGEAGTADKCDLCGGHPLCAASCPVGALALVEETVLVRGGNDLGRS
ncbi:MAG: 4Fe-4S dicluster domain-containing protein [Bacillota bacterium]